MLNSISLLRKVGVLVGEKQGISELHIANLPASQLLLIVTLHMKTNKVAF
jgi:hypothetical protein